MNEHGALGRRQPSLDPDAAAGPDLRLLPTAVVTWAVTWWASAAAARTVLIGAALAATALVGLLAALTLAARGARRRYAPARRPLAGRAVAWLAASSLGCAVLAATLTVTGVHLRQREGDPLRAAAAAGANVAFSGRITSDPSQVHGPAISGQARWMVRVRVERFRLGTRLLPSSGSMLVIGGPAWSALAAGSHLSARARLAPARPGDPEIAVAFPRAGPVITGSGGWIWQAAQRLRSGLRSAARGLPDDGGRLLPALVVGDTSRLTGRLRADLQAAGLTHLTAVSGANVALLAAAVIGVSALAGAERRVRLGVSGLAIAGFVVLARPEPSVLRAAVMGLLALIGLLRARGGSGFPLLAATSLILLIADPWLARSYGFVLSVLATGALLLLVPAWLARLRRWPRVVVLAVGIPLAAQLVTAPVTVLLNPVISVVAVPANLLADPAVGPATVAGVVAAGLSPIWPGGAHLVALAGGCATEWIALVAHRAANVPEASLPWPGGIGGAALLAALSGLLVLLSLSRQWLVLLLLAAVACSLSAPRWVPLLPVGPQRLPPDWDVIQCDVGQGSATLLRSGPDHALMVDAGPDPVLVDRCLRRAGVRVLDLVVLTHFHADHVGGLAGALRGRGSPPIIVSPLAEPAEQAQQVQAVAASIGRHPVVASAGMVGQSGSGSWSVRWRLLPSPLAPAPTGTAADDDPGGTVINNASVVVFAQVRDVRVMALGDVEPEAQQPLIGTVQAAGAALAPVDVLVVAHHGSARQEPQLYRLLRPRVALIGVGKNNDYGHPAASTLTLLRQVGALTLRTDEQGQLAVSGSAPRLLAGTAR